MEKSKQRKDIHVGKFSKITHFVCIKMSITPAHLFFLNKLVNEEIFLAFPFSIQLHVESF